MLYDLDLTLEALLQDELPQLFTSESATSTVSITFGAPDYETVSKFRLPAINLFLYDIQENQELRSNDWRITRQGDGKKALKEPPPVRVTCSFLITAWPSDPSDVQVEHQLLSAVMQVLLRYPKLPNSALRGSLRHQEPPWRAFALGQSKLQSLGEFWQAMGGKPKTTLNYTITVSVPVHKAAQEIPLVLQFNIIGSDGNGGDT
jgi:hypothetical protein